MGCFHRGCLPGGCLPRGCLPSGGVCLGGSAHGDVCLGGSAHGDVCLKGVSVHGGVHLPPSVNRITDRCKNITFPLLRFRAVIIKLTTIISNVLEEIDDEYF